MGAAAPVMAGVAVVGAAYSAYSSYKQGKIAKAAAARNALLARLAADDAEARGAVEAARARSASFRNIMRAKATMLAQGLDPQGAGLMDLVIGMETVAETDALTIRNNAARQAWGLRNQADASLYEGEVAASRANQQMVGDILGGIGSAAQAYALRSPKLPGATKTPTDGLEGR